MENYTKKYKKLNFIKIVADRLFKQMGPFALYKVTDLTAALIFDLNL